MQALPTRSPLRHPALHFRARVNDDTPATAIVAPPSSSFGKPSGGGGAKWYKGHSADHPWNHDLLWKRRVSSENDKIGITKEDNVPLHLQHLVKLQPRADGADARPATAVEERLHQSAAQEIRALEAEIEAEVRKRDRLESKLKKVVEVRRWYFGPSRYFLFHVFVAAAVVVLICALPASSRVAATPACLRSCCLCRALALPADICRGRG